MTFSGDHLEPKSPWSKARSNSILALIVFVIVVLIADPATRGYALVGVAILLSIMLHEAGHFIAAKWSKMKATEFFVGFGPRIWSFHRGETEYGIKAIPLGGYVKIIGMTNLEEVNEDDEARTYRKGRTLKKLIVIMAGVTVNMLLAFILIFAALVGHGEAKDAGSSRAVISIVTPGSSAEKIGLAKGDHITQLNGEKIATFNELSQVISSAQVGDKLKVTFERDGKSISKTTTLTSGVDERGDETGKAQLGITQETQYERVAVLSALGKSATSLYRLTELSINGVMDRFSFSGIADYSKTVVEGDYESKSRPSSVVGIVDQGGQFVNQDIWSIFLLIAFINVFLALVNSLPILPLDGGHAAVAIYERIASKIKKKEVYADHRKLMPVISVFVGAMLLFMLSSLWLDILQIAR